MNILLLRDILVLFDFRLNICAAKIYFISVANLSLYVIHGVNKLSSFFCKVVQRNMFAQKRLRTAELGNI